MKIVVIVGARPNLIKVAPFMKAVKEYKNIKCDIIHTGQHYDLKLSDMFFEDLDIPEPSYNLGVEKSLSPIAKTGEMIKLLEPSISNIEPDAVLVVGDVDSTLAAAVTVSKMEKVLLAHAESGERSYDRTMPEEVNRVVTDHVSDLLFCSHYYAEKNLKHEGIYSKKILVTGDLIIDNLINHEHIIDNKIESNLSSAHPSAYDVVLTLHRPSNVDDKDTLEGILKAIKHISYENSILFPIHPRTRKSIDDFGLWDYLVDVEVVDPMSYIELMTSIKQARCVLTDSGGIQIESHYLGTPCVTVRYNTEAEDTLNSGANMLAGNTPQGITRCFNKARRTNIQKSPLWHGRAAHNMIDAIIRRIEN